jgi:hypothetical protein
MFLFARFSEHSIVSLQSRWWEATEWLKKEPPLQQLLYSQLV